MKQFYVFVSMGKTETFDDFYKIPYRLSGYTEDLSEIRAQGGCVHRKELDNQPTFKGWLGPMWDGGKLRYETQEVYDMMFD